MTAAAMTLTEHHSWLPAGKRAAVCFNVDDVHPATSRDEFDAGADPQVAHPNPVPARAHPLGTAHSQGPFPCRSPPGVCLLPERAAARRVRRARPESRPCGATHGGRVSGAVAEPVPRDARGGTANLRGRGLEARSGLRATCVECSAGALSGPE